MHRVDFSKSFEAMTPGMGGGASPYIKELATKLAFLRNEIFSKFSVGSVIQDWLVRTDWVVIDHQAEMLHLQDDGCRKKRYSDFCVECVDYQAARRGRKAAAHERYDRARVLARFVCRGSNAAERLAGCVGR